MSRVRQPGADIGAHDADPRKIAAFLRALAERVERDAGLAAAVGAALHESGLLRTAEHLERPAPASGRAKRATKSAVPDEARAAGETSAPAGPPPDPFVVYRERGESGLRAALDAQDVAGLRAIIRAHRLDPARISARWANADRLVALIVQQVQARANLGRAFSQV